MINMQQYAVTGRRYRPNYVDIIEAEKRYLPQRKALRDEQIYRDKNFALSERELAEDTRLGREALEANQKASDTSALIGLGQLGTSAYQGRTRDAKLSALLAEGGGGGKDVTGVVAPTVSPTNYPENSISPGAGVGTEGLKPTDGIWSGIKGGAKNWGSIASGALVGGTVGAGLGEKYVPFGGKAERRTIGGAATAGALSYLSSGDPWTAGISAIFGGAIGRIM